MPWLMFFVLRFETPYADDSLKAEIYRFFVERFVKYYLSAFDAVDRNVLTNAKHLCVDQRQTFAS
jgi:hypothetical protein